MLGQIRESHSSDDGIDTKLDEEGMPMKKGLPNSSTITEREMLSRGASTHLRPQENFCTHIEPTLGVGLRLRRCRSKMPSQSTAFPQFRIMFLLNWLCTYQFNEANAAHFDTRTRTLNRLLSMGVGNISVLVSLGYLSSLTDSIADSSKGSKL